jgi:TPR repeat protein
MIDPILDAADADNPAAEYIVASALESTGEASEAARWYRRAADQGYRPALERLGSFPIVPSSPERPSFF